MGNAKKGHSKTGRAKVVAPKRHVSHKLCIFLADVHFCFVPTILLISSIHVAATNSIQAYNKLLQNNLDNGLF